MENYCLKVLIFLPLTYMVLGEKICIKSSPDQPCVAPCSKDVPCLTLCEYFMQEYTQNGTDPAPSNVTLELLSGTHSLWLDSVPDYRISDKASVEVRSDNATIICNNSATIQNLYFQNISVVQISGIKFIDCRYFVFWANTLSIEDSIIVGHHLWSTVETSLVTIVWSSFINGFTLEIRSTTLVIKGSTFINITTRPWPRATGVQCGDGGAIKFTGRTLIVEETIFKNNSAVGVGAACSKGSGGAMYLYTFGRNLKAKISSCSFYGNYATLSGGALFVQGGSLEIVNSSFSLNWGGKYAGALYYQSSILTTDIVSIDNSNFSNNTAGMKGGALYISSSDLTVSLSNAIFSYNSVKEQSGEGGVACIVSDRISSSGYISISKSKFVHNRAPGNAGALCIVKAHTLDISESSFAYNRAGGSGGVILITSDNRNNMLITINQSSFMNNQADVDGGVMYLESNGRYYWWNDRSLVSVDSHSNFTFNTAIRSGGIFTIYGDKVLLDIQTMQICCSNTANFGGIIKACNSSDILLQGELYSRSDPTDIQCTLYDSLYTSSTSSATTQPTQHQASTACTDIASIRRKNVVAVSFCILLSALVLALSIILVCISLYLCGVCKHIHVAGTKSDINDHCVYVPMDESEGIQN